MKKKESREEKILFAMDAIDRAVRNLEKFGNRYNAYIDEAAIHGKDKRAKQLISLKLKVFALADQLKYLKSNFELGVFSAQALSELGKLPDAIAECKGILSESPKWDSLKKSLTSVFKDIDTSEAALAELNNILDPEPAVSYASRLSGMGETVTEEEMSDEFQAEYNAMMERIKPRVAPEAVAKPDYSDVSATGNLDFAGIIAAENKKK